MLSAVENLPKYESLCYLFFIIHGYTGHMTDSPV